MFNAFLLTLIAASTTILGGCLVTFFKKESTKLLGFLLSFSAGVMIYLSFVEILPKGLLYFKDKNVNEIYGLIAFFIGLLLIILIDHLAPRLSHQKDHDEHVHIKKIGFTTMLLITLHNFPEGMTVFGVATESPLTSLPLILAIAIHNLPEGIIISAPIYFSTGNKKKAIVYATISALAEPIGGFVGYYFFKSIFNGLTMGVIFCLISGIMIFLSIDQILPEARKNGDHHIVAYGTVLGIVFMALSLYLLKP